MVFRPPHYPPLDCAQSFTACWTAKRVGSANPGHLDGSNQYRRLVRCHDHWTRSSQNCTTYLRSIWHGCHAVTGIAKVCCDGYSHARHNQCIHHVLSSLLSSGHGQWIWFDSGSRCRSQLPSCWLFNHLSLDPNPKHVETHASSWPWWQFSHCCPQSAYGRTSEHHRWHQLIWCHHCQPQVLTR